MSIITPAYASSEATPATTATTATAMGAPPAVPAPQAGDAFAMNMGLVLVMVVLFYLLLIRPQQKRFKEHSDMLSGLQTGEKIVTQGGMVGTIDKMVSEHEALIDLGNGLKVTVLRSSIMSKYSDLTKNARVANDDKKSKEKNAK